MHAMSETKTNARIIFRTENLLLKSTESISLNIPEGDYVLLSIADNGCGMESDVKEKIFEPFYSTKGANGSGLGLSQVFGFVTRSKGAISVTSELNHGSQFNIYFPRIINNTPPLADILREDINLNGDESILIVDDEVKLQNLAEEILTKHGYKTYSADSAKQALQILEENDIDCLLSDVIMPEMNGHELSVIAKELYPEIKVQLVSGYYGDTILEKSDTLTRNDIIHKPYNSNDLLIKIRRLMDN
jgi:two-component system cell cycle sensor histidine kinase/response regulator CckA